ncbi:MAG: EamA family transporter [Bacteroidota bacterium]
MPVWIVYSLIATLLAGVTAIFVKSSLRDINTEMGLVIRIAIVFVVVLANLFMVKGHKVPIELSSRTLFFLIISGITTGLCSIFYHKAMSLGNVSVISAIDKGSIVITVMLAVAFLGEPLSPKLAVGSVLILTGMVVLIWK